MQTGQIYTGIPSTDMWAPRSKELSKQKKGERKRWAENLLQEAKDSLGAALKNELEQVRYGWGLERMHSQKLL